VSLHQIVWVDGETCGNIRAQRPAFGPRDGGRIPPGKRAWRLPLAEDGCVDAPVGSHGGQESAPVDGGCLRAVYGWPVRGLSGNVRRVRGASATGRRVPGWATLPTRSHDRANGQADIALDHEGDRAGPE